MKAVLVAPTYQSSKHKVPMLSRLEVLLGSVGALEDIQVALQHAKVRTPELRILLTDATRPAAPGFHFGKRPLTRKELKGREHASV